MDRRGKTYLDFSHQGKSSMEQNGAKIYRASERECIHKVSQVYGLTGR